MTGLLVETKLQAPRPRERAVVRPRLDERLKQGSKTRLTLVSAPAGFGKTSLLAGWLAAQNCGRPAAWVSLDERDRDPPTFWTYFLLAVDRAVAGDGVRGAHRAPKRPRRARDGPDRAGQRAQRAPRATSPSSWTTTTSPRGRTIQPGAHLPAGPTCLRRCTW